MPRQLHLETTDVVNEVVNSDVTDLVTYELPEKYIEYHFENVSASVVHVALGQDTALGTRGRPLAPCQLDIAGDPISGTGGIVIYEFFVGDVYFYSLVAAEVRVTGLR